MRTAVGGGQQGQGFVVQTQRPFALELHQRQEAPLEVGPVQSGDVAAFDQLMRLHVEALQLVDRQVDAAAGGVFAHVAHDVGQLEGQAQAVRVVGGLRIGLAEDARGDFADHARHQVAVLPQVGEVEVAVLVQVHLAAVDDRQQVPGLDAVDGGVRHEGLQRRVFRAAGIGFGHGLAPPAELGLGDARVLYLVDHVVHLAAESVEGGDGRPPRRRQEQEGVIEAAAGGCGLLLGVILGRHGSGVGARV